MSVNHPVPSEVASPDSVGWGARFKSLREKNRIAIEICFFFAGFLFDVILLHRIDSTPLLIHQGSYLVLTAVLIFWDHRISVSGIQPTGFLGKLAAYRLWVMHFFLGTLLNAFMVFYFRASSGILAFCFLVGLSVLIVANELPRFREQGPILRVMLLSFAVTSYLAYLLPVLWGQLSAVQYVASVVLGCIATWGLWRFFVRFAHDPQWTIRRAVVPGLVMQTILLGLYFVGAIPPVPLSLKHIGIYADVNPVKDEQGHRRYELSWQTTSPWNLWGLQDDIFVGQTGSKAYAFVRIFAPTKFNDQVRFAWDYYDEEKGWLERGKPFATTLSGGSEEGFRTFAYSTMGRPGKYRVRVLSMDDREIGRKTFSFVEGESPPTAIQMD